MHNRVKTEESIIEYILSALDLPEEGLHRSAHTAGALKAFTDNMPGGFFIYHADEEETILYANTAMLRIFKCDTMEEFRQLTGNSFKGIVHPEELEAVEKSIQEQIAASQYDLDYVEYRIICKDGQIRWIEDYGHFMHSESAGDLFYVFVADATEKQNRLIAEKNAINQEHLRRLEVIEGLSVNYESILYINLDSDNVMIYRQSSRTRYQFPENCNTLGYRQFIQDYISTWVYPEDCQTVLEAISPEQIKKKLAEDKTYYVNYRTRQEEEIQYLQLRIVNVGAKSHISQIVLGCRKVDDEIQDEMQKKKLLEDALNHARLANMARNTFLSNMSHDMRTPLNAISGFTALAKNHINNPDKLLHYLDKIEAAENQLLGLVNDVLEISWMESGNAHIEERECSLPKLMEEIHRTLLPQAAAKDIVLLTDYANLTHPEVQSDQERLRQVLLSLAGNAVKYTNPGGCVKVSVAESEESSRQYAVYQFLIEDNGVGISEEFQTHMFDAFEREKNTTASGIAGTGLGLTIAKNIINMMGGTIEVFSRVGKGSRFTVTISLRILDKPLAPASGNSPFSFNASGTYKILLVEDNELNLEIETELIKEMGFIVDTAMDGSVAVDKISHSRPGEYSLVLMDIQMPVMDGYEAAKAIRGLKDPILRAIPIIAVSSNAFEEDRRRSRESGMNAHIAKPVDYPELLDLIEKTLHQRRTSDMPVL